MSGTSDSEEREALIARALAARPPEAHQAAYATEQDYAAMVEYADALEEMLRGAPSSPPSDGEGDGGEVDKTKPPRPHDCYFEENGPRYFLAWGDLLGDMIDALDDGGVYRLDVQYHRCRWTTPEELADEDTLCELFGDWEQNGADTSVVYMPARAGDDGAHAFVRFVPVDEATTVGSAPLAEDRPGPSTRSVPHERGDGKAFAAPVPTDGEGRTPRETIAREFERLIRDRLSGTAVGSAIADHLATELADRALELLPSAPEGDAGRAKPSLQDVIVARDAWNDVDLSGVSPSNYNRERWRAAVAALHARWLPIAPDREGAGELRAFVESVAAQGCRVNRSESTRWCRDQMESARRAQRGEQPKTGPRWGSAGATGAFRDKIADGAELCLQCRAAELLASPPAAPEGEGAREGLQVSDDDTLRRARALVDYTAGSEFPWSGVSAETVALVFDMLGAAGEEPQETGVAERLAAITELCPRCDGDGSEPYTDNDVSGPATCAKCEGWKRVPKALQPLPDEVPPAPEAREGDGDAA